MYTVTAKIINCRLDWFISIEITSLRPLDSRQQEKIVDYEIQTRVYDKDATMIRNIFKDVYEELQHVLEIIPTPL